MFAQDGPRHYKLGIGCGCSIVMKQGARPILPIPYKRAEEALALTHKKVKGLP